MSEPATAKVDFKMPVLSLLTVIIGGVAIFYGVQQRVAVLEERMTTIKIAQERADTRLEESRNAMREVTGQIREALVRIDGQLFRLNEKLELREKQEKLR